ncbi:phage tail termination protein [Franconibacter helveticus 513]|uniref:phage tail termination protein n=1 Tax=Franconibacter helveticus TaxID=357240 RepID=UPI0003FD4DED|nr:hypothetical protein [Franconibacter helveticus]
MNRGEVYDALRSWLQKHGLDAGYRVQKRVWNELEDTQSDRYLVIQQNGGGATEEALTRDYYRFILLSGQNDASVDEVENRADAIRQALIDNHKTECIISMQPVGGIPAIRTEEGRFLFEINFQTIISR